MTDSPGSNEAGAAGVPPGTLIAGKYRVERLLGEGAVGSVYLARHPRLDLMLAVKMLQSSVARDQQSVERFERGARNLSRVNHPHVCRLYDFGETDDGQLFLVLEYVDGDSLADLIEREGPMPALRACQIVLHICRALHAAHESGIVHRDLKPGNVMIGRSASGQEVAKVVDFDIAKQSEPDIPTEVTQVGYVIGTPEYMSPEQLTGEELDGRSDLYSAGTILYRCLTGKLPFDKASTREIMLARLTEDPVPANLRGSPHPIPAGLQEVLDRSLKRDRNDRWENAAEMASAVARFTEGGYQSSQPSAPILGGEATMAVPATQVAQAVPRPPITPPARHAANKPSGSSPKPVSPSPVGRYAAMGVAGVAVLALGAFAVIQIGNNGASEQAAAVDVPPVEATPEVGPEGSGTSPNPDISQPDNGANPPDDPPNNESQPNGPDSNTDGATATGGASDSGPSSTTEGEATLLTRIAAWDEQLNALSMTVGSDGPPASTVAATREIVAQAERLWGQDGRSSEVRGKAACVVAKGHTTMGSDVDDMRSVGIWARRGLDLYADQAECKVFADMAN